MVLANCRKNLAELSIRSCYYAVTIILLELGLILLTYFLLARKNEADLQQLMQDRSVQVQDVIERQLESFEFTIRRNAAFTRQIGPYISTAAARDFVQFSRFPNRNSVEAYDFIAALPAQDVDKFNEFCDREILAGCYLKEIDPSTAPVVTFKPAQPRPVHYPVTYILPLGDELESVRQYIGLDLGGSSIIRDLLTCARDGVLLTERINLARATPNPNSFGLIMGHPVDKDPASADYEIWGYHTITIRPEDLFNDAIQLAKLSLQDVRYALFDVTEDGLANVKATNISLLYKDLRAAGDGVWFSDEMQVFDVVSLVQTRGRSYKMFFQFSDEFKKKNRDVKVILVPSVLSGLILLMNAVIVAALCIWCTSIRSQHVLQDNKRSGQMLNYVNHEIRNPLNVIQHLVMYTLKRLNHVHEPSVRRISVDKETLETAISDLNIVCNQCSFLEHIVSDVLVIQKLEANMVRLNTQQCSVSDIFKDLEDAIKQKSEENPNVVLQFHCESSALLSVDQFRLKQILLNFLSNAMKYTEQGSITVTADQDEKWTVFAVKDTGKGIRSQDRQKIFTAFTHVASDDAARHGSNGLGLYLCKLLANCMGGSVGFTSSSAGSTFWIKLSNQNPSRLEDV